MFSRFGYTRIYNDNLPVIPPLPEGEPRSAGGPVARCGECGREIYPVESYSCSNNRCPVQPRVTC